MVRDIKVSMLSDYQLVRVPAGLTVQWGLDPMMQHMSPARHLYMLNQEARIVPLVSDLRTSIRPSRKVWPVILVLGVTFPNDVNERPPAKSRGPRKQRDGRACDGDNSARSDAALTLVPRVVATIQAPLLTEAPRRWCVVDRRWSLLLCEARVPRIDHCASTNR
jgi:hypothetical protein